MSANPAPHAHLLRRALREGRGALIAVGLFSLVLNLLILVLPIYSMQVFDRVISTRRLETLMFLTLFAAFALVALGVLETVRSRILARLGTWLDRDLSPAVIAAGVTGTLAGAKTGAQPLRDLAQLRGFFGSGAILPFFDAPWVPVCVGVIALLHPLLGLLAALSAVVLFALALANDLASRAPLARAQQTAIASHAQIDAVNRNAEAVQAMGLLPALVARWNRCNDAALDDQQVAGDRSAAILGASKFVRLFVQVAVTGLGAYLVIRGELSPGGMMASSIILGRALAPVEQAIGSWKTWLTVRGSHQRLAELLARAPAAECSVHLPAPRGHLAVDHLSFAAPGAARPSLRAVSFAVEPGTFLGVVGPSASGKSTLCRLLVGVRAPTAGHVRLDAAEVCTYDRTDFGRHVGYLPQEVELFPGTVAENIARMAPDASSQQVVEAAQLADVHRMILHLPNGYETEICEGGRQLSGGQRQRIGLARALFGRPSLLVLDEPNAHLDDEGERALLRALASAKARGCTVVMVAHRPSVLAHADRLLVLRDGQVDLFGEREPVLRQLRDRAAAPARPSRPALVPAA